MAADNEIRVVISGTAAQLREALAGAKGDLGGLSAAIKAVPDQIKIDVQAETTAAINRLRALQLEAGQIPDEITITADADTGIAMAKLALLNAKVADTQRNIAATQLGGSFTPPPPRGPTVAAGGGDGGRGIDLGRLLLGGGGSLPFAGAIAGTAAFGTLGSFAGLGVEHLITTLLSLAGSATAGAAGGGALALGSAGKLAVGGGSDAAVMKSTIADTKALGQAWQQVGAAQQAAAPSQAQFIKQAKIVADPTVLSDYQKLQQAIKDHGINSTQAATADTALSKAVKAVANPQLTAAFSAWQGQLSGIASATAGLNTQMKALGNTAGVQAELGLAKAASALNTFWDLQTSGARVQAVNILMQGINLAHQFTPLVAQAAQQNLAVINASLKPLFAWLQGPQGVQIFNDLENAFAKELPTAVHAFTQGLELFLRVVDIASQFTGGFVTHLDHLLTRLNSMDNAQLGAVVGRLVADFRLWDTFVKLLVTDVYLLFHQDVGTGNSIVQALTGMLERLHAYETSARGSAQIQSIFMVHKTEILALLALIPGLISGFGGVYMALAPPMVHAMTVILQIIKPVLDAIASIASSSQLAGLAIGGLLISFKFGGILATVAALKSLVQWLLGTKAAAAEATAANVALAASETAVGTGGALETAGITAAASRAGLMTGTSAVAAGTAGFTSAEGMTAVFGTAGIAGMVSSVMAIALPTLAAGVVAYFGSKFIRSQIPGPTTTVSATSSKQTNTGILDVGQGKLNIQETGNFAGFSIDKLKALIQVENLAQKSGAIKITVNGVATSVDELKKLERAAINVKESWNRNFNAAWNAANRDFFKNLSRSLPALTDDFNTAVRKINSSIGLNTSAGLKLWREAYNNMTQATIQGMLTGKIKVDQGLKEINQVIGQGVKLGALTWEQGSTEMFSTLSLLYAQHKISLGQYLGDIQHLQHDAFQHIKSDTQTSQTAMFNYLKDQENKGNLTHGEFLAKWHASQLAANQQSSVDMAAWVATIEQAMKNSGQLTGQGMKVIAGDLNNALGLFGAAKLPIPDAIAWGNFAAQGAANTAQPGPGHRAGGGLVQIGRPGERGQDTIPLSVGGQGIVVGAGEQVAVFNHDQQQVMNQRLADMGGLPGMFSRYNRPHYMAQGGFLPFTTGGFGSTTAGGGGAPAPGSGWQNVTASAESLGGTGYRGNPIQPDGYSELSMPPSSLNFSALGNLPYQTHMRIRSGSRQVVAAKQDVGAGSSFLPVMGLYPGTVAELGLSGGEFHVSIERADGVPLTLSFGGAGGGAAIPTLTAPRVGGKGPLADIVRGALKLDTAAANTFLQAHAPAPSAGGGGGGGGPGATGPAGLGTFDGLQVADWIIPVLNWARAHGWSGHVTSGFRGGFDPSAPSGSEHAGTQWPSGAIDVGGPGAVAEGTQLYDVLKGYPGHPNLLWGGIYISGYTGPGGHDYGHFSGTGHARGGLVEMLAGGGMVPGFATGGYSSGTTAPGKKGTGKKIPPEWLHRKPGSMRRHKKHKGLPGKAGGARGGPTKIGTDGPFPFDITDLPQIDKVLSQILGLDGGAGGSLGGGDAAKMSDLITWNEQLWGSSLYPSPNFSDAASPGNFVISTDAAGNAVTSYISTNINQVVQQLSQIVGWEGEELTDMQGALKLSQGLGPAIQKAIARRQKEVAKIRKRIEENSRKIVALLARIKMLNQKKPPHAKPKTAAERAENAAFDRERKWEIAAANLLISDYEKENVQLGGAKRKVGSPAGGELGTIGAELGTPASTGAMGTVLGTGASATGGLYQLQSVVSGWVQSLSGVGGALESTGLTFAEDQQTLAKLLPGANVALSAAAAQAAGASGPDLSALNALLQQELDQSRQAFALSQAQFNVFQGFEPLLEGRLLGSFQSGTAFVPHTGPYLLHRGEQIIPDPAGPAANSAATVHTAQGPVQIDLHFEGDSGTLVRLVDARMNKQALKIVSSHSGQRARLMSGVRRP